MNNKIGRREIWWASLSDPSGSSPGYDRPVLIVQSDDFNKSKINTAIVIALTKTIGLANAPGNVLIKKKQSKLPLDTVANVSQMLTIDKSFLRKKISTLDHVVFAKIEDGMRLILSL